MTRLALIAALSLSVAGVAGSLAEASPTGTSVQAGAGEDEVRPGVDRQPK